jgi:hypothetical protein
MASWTRYRHWRLAGRVARDAGLRVARGIAGTATTSSYPLLPAPADAPDVSHRLNGCWTQAAVFEALPQPGRRMDRRHQHVVARLAGLILRESCRCERRSAARCSQGISLFRPTGRIGLRVEFRAPERSQTIAVNSSHKRLLHVYSPRHDTRLTFLQFGAARGRWSDACSRPSLAMLTF